jgi:hypothetical protein
VTANNPQRPVSKPWIAISILIFMALELLLGGLVSDMLEGRTTSHMLKLRIELALSLLSFLFGGFLVGVFSPGPRLVEPAVGAAVTVVFTFLISFFTPVAFLQASGGRILIGGVMAFGVALFGAHFGEKLTGN